MKRGLFFVLFLSLVAVALSAQATVPKPKGKPGHCWTPETGPLKSGEERNRFKNECLSITCSEDSSAEISTCIKIISPTGLTEPDYSKPYPKCCPKPIGL